MVTQVCLSTSSVFELEDCSNMIYFNQEYINIMCPNCVLGHITALKVDKIIIVLRNIFPKDRIGNGTEVNLTTIK